VKGGGRERVFVYGSLKRGFSLYHYLRGPDAAFLEPAAMAGYALYRTESGYSGAVPDEGGEVRGEVFEVEPALLERLDDLEDEGRVYERVLSGLVAEGGGRYEAWVYVYRKGVRAERRIPSGVWTEEEEGG
jgi:gamma-glutamylcyclotransferase (GGCT)/AIG2-like uncharacterized protein YtfP